MTNSSITKEDKKILKEAEKIINTAENTVNSKNKNISIAWLFISIFIIAFILLILSTIFAIINNFSDKIVSGTNIKGIDVSNLTKIEAKEKVTDIISTKLGEDLILTHNEEDISLSPADIYSSFDIDGAVDLAYRIGRHGNIFENNYEIITAYLSNYSINPSFSYSPELLNEKLTLIEQNLPDYIVQPSYSVNGNTLKIQNGKQGVLINRPVLSEEIIHALNNLENSNKKIEIPTIVGYPNPINLDYIYNEVHKEPVDAYYTKNPFAVHPSSTGIDFKISLNEAKEMIKVPKDEYIIPLKVVYPKVTTNDIGSEAFPDLLSSFSTNFNSRNANRANNIRIAARKINGTVLMPGETFSYNKVVGKRTEAAGFKTAGVYLNGEVSEGIGGGICQVSSTLYNSVLLSNLQVTQRRNHTFHTGYVPVGQDATVSWGGPDLKFKNNRNYPVRIIATVNGGTITTKIYGLKQDDDYSVKIKSSVVESIPFKTTYKVDHELKPGTTKVVQKGSNGLKSVTYKILYKNGKQVSSKIISRDTYKPHNQIIAKGV